MRNFIRSRVVFSGVPMSCLCVPVCMRSCTEAVRYRLLARHSYEYPYMKVRKFDSICARGRSIMHFSESLLQRDKAVMFQVLNNTPRFTLESSINVSGSQELITTGQDPLVASSVCVLCAQIFQAGEGSRWASAGKREMHGGLVS